MIILLLIVILALWLSMWVIWFSRQFWMQEAKRYEVADKASIIQKQHIQRMSETQRTYFVNEIEQVIKHLQKVIGK